MTTASILVLDADTHQVITEFHHPELRGAREFVVTPDGFLYIALNFDGRTVYDEILVLNAATGTVVTRLKTGDSPMGVRWVGHHTVLVSHTAIEEGGFSIALVDTRAHTISHQFKLKGEVFDAVAVNNAVYIAEARPLEGILGVYDLATKQHTEIVNLPGPGIDLALNRQGDLYVTIGGLEDESDEPCTFRGGEVVQVDPATKTVVSITPLTLPADPPNLRITPNQHLLVKDDCTRPGQSATSAITVLDPTTGMVTARLEVEQRARLSPVTPQGEIAVYFDDQIHWYDANTLEARGQSVWPIGIVNTMVLPTWTDVQP